MLQHLGEELEIESFLHTADTNFQRFVTGMIETVPAQKNSKS